MNSLVQRNQWEFRPGTCETWAYLESIVHYWQTWKSITVLAASMNGRLLSDFFHFAQPNVLVILQLLYPMIYFFSKTIMEAKQMMHFRYFFDSKKNLEKKRRSVTKSASFHDFIRNFTEEKPPAFSSTLHASSSADIPWPTNWPWKIQGLRIGWPERPWVGLESTKKDNKNTFLGINYFQTSRWHMQQ